MNISSTTYPDSATRWTPDVADVPEGFGISAALNVPYLETLTLLQRTFGNAVIVSNQGPDFTSVNCPYLTDPGPNFQITNNARLTTFTAPNLGLNLAGSSLAHSSLILSGNAISQAN